MHPLDTNDRRALLKDRMGLGMCNITKCCTEVCPENIRITDNAIIPLKERVADEFYDPLKWAWRKLTGKGPDAVRPWRAAHQLGDVDLAGAAGLIALIVALVARPAARPWWCILLAAAAAAVHPPRWWLTGSASRSGRWCWRWR